MTTDGTLGLAQASTPDHYLDAGVRTNDDGTSVVRPRVAHPEILEVLRLVRGMLARLGSTIVSSSYLDANGSPVGAQNPAVRIAWGMSLSGVPSDSILGAGTILTLNAVPDGVGPLLVAPGSRAFFCGPTALRAGTNTAGPPTYMLLNYRALQLRRKIVVY